MFIVTDQEGNVTKYRSLRNKRLSKVSISCTKDSDVEDAILDECAIQSEFDMMFKRCHLRNCRINNTTVLMVESVSYQTHYHNVTFRHVNHSSITNGSISNSILKDIQAHFVNVHIYRIDLQGALNEIFLNRCTGMVSTAGLGSSDRVVYCYKSPDGPRIAMGCFRGTRAQATLAIAAKYDDSKKGELYLKAVDMLFDLLEDQ